MELGDGVVQYGLLGFFEHVPYCPATVDSVVRALMTVFAKRDAKILVSLLDVVCITWP